jgi:hypothetical protein
MMADDDSPTCVFSEFSSKWRTGFSHLCGESENETVVPLAGISPARCSTTPRVEGPTVADGPGRDIACVHVSRRGAVTAGQGEW